MRSHHRPALLCALILAAALVTAGIPANADSHVRPGGDPVSTSLPMPTDGSLTTAPTVRIVPPKPQHTRIPAGYSRRVVIVKFAEGTDVQLHGRELTAPRRVELDAVTAALTSVPGAELSAMFSTPAAALERQLDRIESRSGRDLADPSLYVRIVLPRGEDAAGFIDRLNADPAVELAAPEPLPRQLPVTPNFEPQQVYRDPAPQGIDVDTAAGVAGAAGGNVRVVDIEYSWNRSHEDLSKASPASAIIANGTPADPFGDTNHGTAVIGELVADANGIGVTGIVPNATLRLANAYSSTTGYDLANAIDLARQATSAGDVILIEQQIAGPGGACGTNQVGCIAVEWFQAYYDAIATATAAGRIIVEAAGNGYQNLSNTSLYGNPFPAGRADSGAIIVGAGGGANCSTWPQPLLSRLEYSNYGSRVNLQGWGECVVTTGYGDKQGGNANQWYTSGFGGTSSASPIVAGAAASVSSAYEQAGLANPTSAQMRTLLTSTGTEQNTSGAGALAGHIGPLPDLQAALASLTGGAPTVTGIGPSFGPVGMFVTVIGTNFANATAVRFNGVTSSFTVLSPTVLVATVPAGATDGPIRVSNTNGGGNSQTAFDVTPGTVVEAKNDVFTPKTVTIEPGQAVGWNFLDQQQHSVRDAIGLGSGGAPLFDSGPLPFRGSFVLIRNAAGRYDYESKVSEPLAMQGTISVRVLAKPKQGGLNKTFAITWAKANPGGYHYQVQYRHRSTGGAWGAWTNLFPSTTSLSAGFQPDQGRGTYAFRSRLVNSSTGIGSRYSVQTAIKVV